MSTLRELGRTRLHTRRDRARRNAAFAVAGLGALAAVALAAPVASLLTAGEWASPQLTLRSPTDGDSSGLLGLPTAGDPHPEPSRPQLPVTLDWPTPAWATALVAVPLWLAWARYTVRPLLRGLGQETRHRGLASLREIRQALGTATARRAGRFTLPALPTWQRLLRSDATFGPRLGYPRTPRDRRLALRADWEQRIRVIARTGWGKTARLLVPIVRQLPGSAVISSIEPSIFTQTVTARQHRRIQLRPRLLDWLFRQWLPVREYPVACADLSSAAAQPSAGYEQVEWNPIDGCEHYPVAHRRAHALIYTTETDGDGDDAMFRDAARDVLAVWLHAAALGDYEIEHLQRWLEDTTDTQPTRIVHTDRRADPAALPTLRKHLDPRAEKTTSGVERYLMLALGALTSAEGRAFCGRRIAADGTRIAKFDPQQLIASGGTLYILTDPTLVGRQRPLLSLFANETFYAAEQVALRQRRNRLPWPHVAVLDELAKGVMVTDLPYVATTQRKYGISYVYSVQSSAQEEALFGEHDATALRDSAGVSIIGGYDGGSANDIQSRAGSTPVVTPTRGERYGDSEHVEHQDALTIADQQELQDGESVVLTRGTAPFLAYTPATFEQRRRHRRITAEERAVTADAAAARARRDARTRAAVSADQHGLTTAGGSL